MKSLGVKMKNKIILYTQPNCNYCDWMKGVLTKYEFEYEAIDISKDVTSKLYLSEEGHKTVPQLYVNNIHVNKKNTLGKLENTINKIYFNAN